MQGVTMRPFRARLSAFRVAMMTAAVWAQPANAVSNRATVAGELPGWALRAPSSDIAVPTSIAPLVRGIIGLDQSDQLVHTNMAGGNSDADAPPSPAFLSAQPCSAYWGEKIATGFTNPYGRSDLPY